LRLSKFKTVALSVMVLGLIAGCSSQQTGQTGRMGMSQRAVPVEVKKAATEDFGVKLSLSGRLEATQQVSVTPKASGRVKQIHVSIGDQVKAGQPLVTLDEQEASIQLQRSQASLLSAQARYAEVVEGTPEETVKQTQNTLAEMQNKYNAAKKELERTEALYKEGAISVAEYEQAKDALVSATTSLENQKQKLKTDQKGPTKAELDSATATLKQAQADYQLAQLDASNLVVKAPIDGIVGTLPITVGSNISTSTEVTTLINLSTMKVKTQATESQVGMFKNGQTVDVQIPSADVKTKGTITSVSPLADDTKSYPIEIQIPNPDLTLKVGMIASVEMTGELHKALVVPREAVISQNKGNFVFVVEQDKAKQVHVELGESDGTKVEILKGLTGTETVVVKGQNTLSDGSTVTVIDPNQPVNTQGQKGKRQQNGQGNGQQQRQGQGNPGAGGQQQQPQVIPQG